MWWPSRPILRWTRAAAGAAALAALAGCGFQPLYGTAPGSAEPTAVQSVYIAPLRDRIGQQLHNALRDRLNPKGQPGDPAYRLNIQIKSITEARNLRSDATATLREFDIRAKWELADYASGDTLFKSTAEAANSYSVVDQPYATKVAFRDARTRAIDVLADTISARVAGVLAKRSREAAAAGGS
jgi:LPS-assembly lipoprotein